MTESGTALHVTDEGYSAAIGDGREVGVAIGDAIGWGALVEAIGDAAPATIVVPSEATFTIALPSVPQSDRELRGMLLELSPVVPEKLAWTRPLPSSAAKSVSIRLAHRAWLDRRVGEIERHLGVDRLVVVDIAGNPFRYLPPGEARRWRVTAAAVAIALLTAAAALGVRLAKPDISVSLAAARTGDQEPVFSRPGVAQMVARIAFSAPAGSRVAALSQNRAGVVSVEIDTVNPVELRSALTAQGILRGFHQAGRERRADQTFRVRYSSMASASRGARLAPALATETRAAALREAERGMTALAKANGIALTVTPLVGLGDGVLRFSILAVGTQERVLTYADALESREPLTRLEEWRIVPDPMGIRLTGFVLVPWQISA